MDFSFQGKHCHRREMCLLSGTRIWLMKKFQKELDGTHRKGGSNTIKSILPMHRKGGAPVLLTEI